MNPDASTPTPPSSPNINAALPPANPVPPFDWRYWARRLLVCNPFFLCSAALLLFGVNRLSLDPSFLGEERANLFFNYGALQSYECLVVVTAIILARRKIWYDAALLAVVENGLVLVPFMLISQGALMSRATGLLLAAGAVCFAAGRSLALRRLFPEFNLPPRALVLGTVQLLMNAVLPVLYPPTVVNDPEDWAGPNHWLWFAAWPALIAGANFLARPKRYGGTHPERHWLPLFNYALWTAGTGTHFWSLGHVSGLPFHWEWLGPGAVAAAWTFFVRLGDCAMTPSIICRRAVLILAFLAPLVSFANAELFEVLVLVNAIGFAVLLVRGASMRTFAREMLVLCLPLAAFGLPQDVGRVVMPYFTRTNGFPVALSLLLVICSLRWFRAMTGCTGAVGLTILMAFMSPGASPHAYLQTAVIFVLTHSLAWREKHIITQFVRSVAGFFWLLNAAVWVHNYGLKTDFGVTLSALLLLATWLTIWRFSHERPDLVVAASASAVTLCAPTDWLLVNGSTGLLALTGSALLFVIGFAVAWTRHRWERARP